MEFMEDTNLDGLIDAWKKGDILKLFSHTADEIYPEQKGMTEMQKMLSCCQANGGDPGLVGSMRRLYGVMEKDLRAKGVFDEVVNNWPEARMLEIFQDDLPKYADYLPSLTYASKSPCITPDRSEREETDTGDTRTSRKSDEQMDTNPFKAGS